MTRSVLPVVRGLSWIAAILAILALGRHAAAQSAPQLQLRASATTVGVGDVFEIELSATSADTMPADAQLGGTHGFVVRGQNPVPSQTHISINGNRMDRYTLTMTWQLEAQRVGTFHVGPATVLLSGARYSVQPLTISVVPAGQAPRPRASAPALPPGMWSPFRFSPFDPWKGLLPQGIDGDDQGQGSAPQIPIDPKLSLESARGPFFFLHATVDKTTAVVGEQVTYSVYAYSDLGERADVDGEAGHESTAADFVKHPMLREDQDAPRVGYAMAGGRTWEVKLLRRWALFPLHTGDLVIGPMRLNVVRPQSAAGPSRTAETIVVHVTEPPLAGRPPGYTLGDVGHFSLTAQVSPREIEEGGAISVHVELSGTGNLPTAIPTPARAGVEWLTPETHGELAAMGHDAWGGKRTIDYVVRMRRPGSVDLGELALPFWDPDQRRYELARAPLGVVRVTRSAAGANASADPARETLPGLPAVRDRLEGTRGPRAHADDSPVFWIAGVGLWPLSILCRGGGSRRGSARRRRMAKAARLA